MYALYSTDARADMPPKQKKTTDSERVQMRVSPSWLARINLWRRAQPDPMPSLSEAIRTLVNTALEAERKRK
jgi:hypothetical protein